MAEVETGMERQDIKRLLAASKKEPVNCAFAASAKDGVGILLLHKTKPPKTLQTELQKEFPDAKNPRFGTALVDTDSDASLVKFIINKPVSGMGRRLVKTLKGTGFSKVEIALDDGSSVESSADEQDEAAAPIANEAAPAAANGAAPAVPTDKTQAAELQRELTALVAQVKAETDPEKKQKLAELTGKAVAALKSGDLAGAEAAMVQLRATLATAPRAAPAQGADGKVSKLQETLLLIKLKISDYADSIEQETDWLTRADAAQAALDAGSAEAAGLIQALGKELMAAAEALRKADGPWKDWNKVFEDCEKQAAGLKQALLRDLVEHGQQDSTADFEKGWATLEQELADIGEVLEKAHKKAHKAKPAEAGAIVKAAASQADKTINASELLKDIDDNDLQPVTVVASLRRGLQTLERAVAEAKP